MHTREATNHRCVTCDLYFGCTKHPHVTSTQIKKQKLPAPQKSLGKGSFLNLTHLKQLCCCWQVLSLTLCYPMDYSSPGSSVMGYSRQEYWSGLPFPPLGDIPDPGIEPASLVSPALAGGFFTTSTTWEATMSNYTLTTTTTTTNSHIQP